MMRFFTFKIFFGVLFSISCVYGQDKFIYSYGELNSDIGVSISVLDNGSIVFLGTSDSYNNGDLLLTKVNKAGGILWSKTYGGPANETAVHMEKTNDGGFILLGNTLSFGSGSEDIYLVKTDSIGNVVWSKVYGGLYGDFAGCVKETPNGGYIIAGRTQSFGEGEDDGYLIRLDTNGKIVWSNSYGTNSNERFYYVDNTNDNGFIISGIQKNYSSYFDQLVIKVDGNGNILFSKNFGDAGGTSYDAADCIKETADGGFLFSGQYRAFGLGGEDLALTKIDSKGNLEWSKVFGNSMNDRAFDFAIDESGNCILAGYTNSFGAGVFDAFFVKVDQFGSPYWYKTYGSTSDDYFAEIEITDNGYVMVGNTFSFGAGGSDIFVVKTDFNGLNDISCSNLSVTMLNVFPVKTDIIQRVNAGGISKNVLTIANEVLIKKTNLITLSFPGLNSVYPKGLNEVPLEAIPSGGTFTIDGVNSVKFIPSSIGGHVLRYEYPMTLNCTYNNEQNIEVLDGECKYNIDGYLYFSEDTLIEISKIFRDIGISLNLGLLNNDDFVKNNTYIEGIDKFYLIDLTGERLFIDSNIPPTTPSHILMKYRNGFDAFQMEHITTNKTGEPLQVEPTPFVMIAADVDLSDKIRSNDISLLQQKIVQQIDGFPQKLPPEIDKPYLDWRFIDKRTVDEEKAFQKGNKYPLYATQGYSRDNVPDVPFYLSNQGSCSESYQETYYSILIGDLVSGGTGIDINNFNSNSSTITLDIDDVHDLGGNTYRVFFNHSLSSSDKLVALDMALDYDETAISIVNTKMTVEDNRVAPQWLSNDYHAQELLFTSYSMSGYPSNGNLLYIDVNKTAGPPSIEDLGKLYVFMNGVEVPATIRLRSQMITGIDEDKELSDFVNLYPNPVDDQLTVSLPLCYSKDVHIEFFNSIGQSVLLSEQESSPEIILDLSSLPAGLYHCIIALGDKTTVVKKVIVK